jgi:hypothetical protein
MLIKRIPQFKVIPQSGVRCVPGKALELHGMCPCIHSGRKRAPFQAVPAEGLSIQPGSAGAGLNDARDRAICQRLQTNCANVAFNGYRSLFADTAENRSVLYA